VWLHRPPLFGAAVVIFETVIIWMKLISYVAVNEHYRTRPEVRDRSESFRAGKKGGSSVVVEQPKRASDATSQIEGRRVRYPENVTAVDIYYFMSAPTLCYELNFPRTNRVRGGFLFRRCAELVFLLIIITSLVQQWIFPLVAQSLVELKSDSSIAIMVIRTLKLAVPNIAIWLLFFYAYFHAFMNACAEVLRFGDRQFYRDWWNAPNVQYFWSNWNIPVHKWLQRHIYRPLRAAGVSKLTAVTTVFLLSAVLHEVVIGIPLGILSGYSIGGMLGYVPLALMINTLYDVTNMSKTWGNVLVWLSLLVGQPAGMLMYAVAYRKLHANDAIAAV
jgi:diacylglycerol O-acyltransferase-1